MGVVYKDWKRPTWDNSNDCIVREYRVWYHILERTIYNSAGKNLNSYKDVKLCDRWLQYDNFYDDVVNDLFGWNFTDNNGRNFCVDKDIKSMMFGTEKEYSLSKVCMVPNILNNQFHIGNGRSKNTDLPFGVCMSNKVKNRYDVGGEWKGYRYFKTSSEAQEYYIFKKTEKLHKILKNYECKIEEDVLYWLWYFNFKDYFKSKGKLIVI